MAAIFGTESYETGAVGDTVTSGNTTHSNVGAGWTFEDTPAPPIGLGTKFAKVEVAAGVTSYAQASFTATDICVPRMYVRFPTVPTTGAIDLATARAGASLRARLGIVDGKYVMRNGGTVVWTSTEAVAATVWNRLEWRLNNTTGEQQLRIFRGSNHHGTTADEDSAARTFTSGAAFDQVRFGPANNALTTSWSALYDATIISDVTWPGPGYTGDGGTGSVTVSAGADQIAVEPWQPVTLQATVTGSGVTSMQWTQLQGTPVALAGATTATATFPAPASIAGEALQFKFAATYATGVASGVTDVTVRAVTERIVVGGVEVPLRILLAQDPDPLVWDPAAAWIPSQAWGEH